MAADDNISDLIKQTSKELQESKKALQDLANEITHTADIVQPALEYFIKSMRSARMTTVNEIREMIGALREVRQFFMDEHHTQEIVRLEQFVNLCERLRALKQDGTLDAVADTILKLGVGIVATK